eukprot:CFRG3815T1
MAIPREKRSKFTGILFTLLTICIFQAQAQCLFDSTSRLVTCVSGTTPQVWSGGCSVENGLLNCYGLPEINVSSCDINKVSGLLQGKCAVLLGGTRIADSCRVVQHHDLGSLVSTASAGLHATGLHVSTHQMTTNSLPTQKSRVNRTAIEIGVRRREVDNLPSGSQNFLYCPGSPYIAKMDTRLYEANSSYTSYLREISLRTYEGRCLIENAGKLEKCSSVQPWYFACADNTTDPKQCLGEERTSYSLEGCSYANGILFCNVCDDLGCGQRAISAECETSGVEAIKCTGLQPFPGPCYAKDGVNFDCSHLPVKDLACLVRNDVLDCTVLHLPGEIALWDLDLTNRGITVVGANSFSSGSNISSIDLSFNDIYLLRDGPFNQFPHIISLNISNNKLSVLNKGTFREILSLKTIDLSNNSIGEISVGAFDQPGAIENLYLQNNEIRALPQYAFDSPLLTFLDVSGNPLDCCSMAFAAEELRGGSLIANAKCTSIQRTVTETPVTLVNQDDGENFTFQMAYNDFRDKTFSDCVNAGRCSLTNTDIDIITIPHDNYTELGAMLRKCDSCYASHYCDGSNDRRCVDGIDGPLIGIPLSQCLRLPGTTCHSIGNHVECRCKEGYNNQIEGDDVEDTPVCSDVNECAENPCDLGLECRNTFGGFVCCPPGSFGASCTVSGVAGSLVLIGEITEPIFQDLSRLAELLRGAFDLDDFDIIKVSAGSVILDFVAGISKEALIENLSNDLVMDELMAIGILSINVDDDIITVQDNPSNDNPSNKVSFGAVVAIAVCVALVLLLMVIIVLVLYRKFGVRKEPDTAKLIEKLKKQHMWTEAHDQTASQALRNFKHMQEGKGWLPREAFTMLERIGGGAYGDVYRGVVFVENRAVVCAIKTMRKTDEKSKEEFLREIKILFKMDHPNIVSIIGASISSTEEAAENEGHETVYLLLEFLGFGDLHDYLNIENSISLEEKIWFSWQISRGLCYVADTGTVHRDIAARNVLLGEATEFTHGHPTIKISDMGLARLVEDGGNYMKTSEGGLLPYRWMAPESIEYCAYSEKSDVWSFGITVWEIFNAGAIPYGFLHDFVQVREALRHGLRESRCAGMPEELYQILLRCWETEPNNRPTFSDLERDLENQFLDCQKIADKSQFALSVENETSYEKLKKSDSDITHENSKERSVKTNTQYTDLSNTSASRMDQSDTSIYTQLAGSSAEIIPSASSDPTLNVYSALTEEHKNYANIEDENEQRHSGEAHSEVQVAFPCYVDVQLKDVTHEIGSRAQDGGL